MRRIIYSMMFLAFVGSSICSFAQVSRGTLTGRVTDATGAVIPGVHIVATQSSTGSHYDGVSNDTGNFTIPFLAPGTYSVTAICSGFKKYVHAGIIVPANEQVSADIQLQIGASTQTVTVSAGSTLLQTGSAEIGQTLNSEDVRDIPVDGNTPLILSQEAMGVIPTGNPQFFHPYDGSGPSGFSMGGAPAEDNELLLDGAPDYSFDGTVAYNPPMDSVQQVKVEAFEPDAAYGHTAGGTVNQILKSGTNHYHGTLYEYGQWSALNDTPWFTREAGAEKPVTRYNQYGGSFGGPVIIPKVFNGHNKMFAFFAYEGINDNAASPSIVTVPTLAEREGNFSALLNFGSNYTIYDPSTGVVQGSNVKRQPFPKNIIPPSDLSQVGMNLVSYFGKPNLPGLPNGENNYYYPGNSKDSFDSELGRIDINLSKTNKMFFDMRHNNRYHTSGNVFNNIATGSILVQPNWGATLDDVQAIGSQTAWENRLNWTRNITSRPLQSSTPLTKLGFPSYLQSASTHPGFPVTSIPTFVGFGYSKGQYVPFDDFQLFTILSRVAGRHTLEFGADLRLAKESAFQYGNSSGLYAFGPDSGQAWTNGPYSNSASAPVGQELASLELGLPTSGSFDINTNETTSAKYFAFFVEDNYHVLPHLNLALGLRFEHDSPTVESHNRAVNGFDLAATSPINAEAQAAYAANPTPGVSFPDLQGGLTFSNSDHRAFYKTSGINVSPRIGIAWSPRQNTSLRGGFGIFNNSVGRVNAISPGFNQTTEMEATRNGYLSPYATLSNPFPDGLLQPPGSTAGLSTNLGQSISFYPQELLNDYAVRWDTDLQENLPGNTLLEIGYMGSHMVHIGVNKSLNYVPAQYLNVGQVRDNSVVNYLTQSVDNPFYGLVPGSSLNGSTVQLQQLLLAYPQYTSVTLMDDPIGSSMFDMLQARLEKRMSHGIRFIVNYEWSKELEKIDFLNPQDTSLEKRIGSDDRPQRLVLSGTWQLPFGRQRWANPHNRIASYLSSGWNLTGIYTLQPYGAPLAWGDVIYRGSSLNNLEVHPGDVNGAFDTSLFDTKASDQPITDDHIRTLPTQVTHARQDGINSLDLSISKQSHITRKLSASLRADFFNALNRPQFSSPNLNPTSSGFGKITSQANLPRQMQIELKLSF